MEPIAVSSNCHFEHRPAAFTLIELLVVISILGILMMLVSPTISSITEGNNLSRSAHQLANQIRLARQNAAVQNRVIEVRLIRLPSVSAKGYNATQLWTTLPPDITTGTETMKPDGRAIPLPQSIVIAEDSTNLSPLLASISTVNTMPTHGANANASYVAFQVRPSGVIVPTLGIADLYLTLVPARFGGQSTFPANYAIVQINPNTGVPLVYRP
jgi:uncharacterized protein (TIGR02596 family)